MLIYLPFLLFQPWKKLSKAQRKFVWRECVQPLVTRWPILVIKSMAMFFAILIPLMMVVKTLQGWKLMGAMFLVVFLMPELFDMIVLARYRRRVIEYIQEHRPEIESVA
jgi:hypothetical protein